MGSGGRFHARQAGVQPKALRRRHCRGSSPLSRVVPGRHEARTAKVRWLRDAREDGRRTSEPDPSQRALVTRWCNWQHSRFWSC